MKEMVLCKKYKDWVKGGIPLKDDREISMLE
jgi:hypothetical protein